MSSTLPHQAQPERGLHIERTFSTEGTHPFDELTWVTRTAAIKNHKGEAIFEQQGVEFPDTWSRLATNVVSSKYFYGDLDRSGIDPAQSGREHSLKQLVHRVTRTIADWGIDQHYFASKADGERFYDELTWLCVNQYGAFNSPVWFNVGLHHQYGIVDSGNRTISGWNAGKKKVTPVDPYARPQASACFIISVDDSIDGIWQLMGESARLFKFGSGVGADWSTLRSTQEKLSGGGTPSGPVSFMRVQDATGGTIKSGGKTRRAAIMQTLKIWHPDVMEFVQAKAQEERKAWALIEQGYDGSFNGPAYGSVDFQNVNQSVRVTDTFMQAAADKTTYGLQAVTTGEVIKERDAASVLRTISEGTHICGDPGMQYEDTIQKWHTCKNSGPINSSNPCVTGDTLVATSAGPRRIDALLGETPRVVGLDDKLHRTTRVIETGIKPVYRLRTQSGYTLKLTADHRVWTENRGDVSACELTKDDVVRLMRTRFGQKSLDPDVAEYLGLMLGDGCISGPVATLSMNKHLEHAVAEKMVQVVNRFERQRGTVHATQRDTSVCVATSARAVRDLLASCCILDQGAAGKQLTPAGLTLDRKTTAALLRGLFTADGTVAHYGKKSQYVALDSTSETLLEQVQILLLGFGIKSKIYRNRRLIDRALMPDGNDGLKSYPVQQVHSLRISRSSRRRFEAEIGFMAESHKANALQALNRAVDTYIDQFTDPVATLELLGEEPVYDLTEPATDHFVANGIAVHNCSEYMFLDDSACNLASLNLRKYQHADGSFDTARYRSAARIFITAMEILVDNAGYPAPMIAKNSHDYRPLGLGFANLGALLMSMGLPYDSDEGRSVAGALMAMLHCEAYARSAEIAANEKIGSFAGFKKNRKPMLEVMRMHRDAVADIHESCPTYLRDAAQAAADAMVDLGEKHGYRNAQATVLAPTGTISFMMDCDTTGIEPDIALVKYKLLAGKGDGLMKIVNQTVPESLARLGYAAAERETILAFIDTNDTIEGAPGLNEAHLPVFDCAFKPFNGTRFIHHMGHIKMMAACQPFISGAISKTVNLPEDCTTEDIAEAYSAGWSLGLKAVAIYRENSKRSQPLSTSKDGNTKNAETAEETHISGDGALSLTEPEIVEKIIEKVVYKPMRKRLPDERPSMTHKFSIAGHEGYLHVGLYPDTQLPGEIFITMAKQGSTLAGVMDALATAVSLALQYGVPLEDLISKFSHTRFEPSGFTNNKQIPIAKSIVDYIFRYLSVKFIADPAPKTTTDPVAVEVARQGPALDEVQMALEFDDPTAEAPTPLVSTTVEPYVTAPATKAQPSNGTFRNQEDAPACSNCGSITIRSGACYSCPNCGGTSGCG